MSEVSPRKCPWLKILLGGVALLFKNDPRKFTIENPLSFMQYPVQPEGLEMVVPCEARTAGAIIYYPMSMLIATGIC